MELRSKNTGRTKRGMSPVRTSYKNTTVNAQLVADMLLESLVIVKLLCWACYWYKCVVNWYSPLVSYTVEYILYYTISDLLNITTDPVFFSKVSNSAVVV